MQVSDEKFLSKQDSKGSLDLGLCLRGHNDSNVGSKDESEALVESEKMKDKGVLMENVA